MRYASSSNTNQLAKSNKKLSPAMFAFAKANRKKLENPTPAQKKIFAQYDAMVKAGDTPANPKPRPSTPKASTPKASTPKTTTTTTKAATPTPKTTQHKGGQRSSSGNKTSTPKTSSPTRSRAANRRSSSTSQSRAANARRRGLSNNLREMREAARKRAHKNGVFKSSYNRR